MVLQENWRKDLPATGHHPHEHETGQLLAVAHLLSERDQSFAVSLIDQAQKRGSLTEKQLYWVGELTARATRAAIGVTQPAPAAPAPAPAPAAKTFGRIVALFAKAGGRGAIIFKTASGAEFRLSVAGERSQQPGSINVTDAAQGFDSRVWFGRITTAGAWQPSRKIDTTAVEAALALFNADPDAASAAYGRETGNCCFCGRELTDERSVSVGRGPVCSERWGLPWGEVPGPAKESKLECSIPF